ncbi:MAG: hypothetical protein AAGF99_09585, partial [Bacteroidota bacterium]
PEAGEQDWEWGVADADRIATYLDLYPTISAEEQACLMEVLVQAIADLGHPEQRLPDEWEAVAALLRAQPRLHADSIDYWSGFESPHEWSFVGAGMRALRAPTDG